MFPDDEPPLTSVLADDVSPEDKDCFTIKVGELETGDLLLEKRKSYGYGRRDDKIGDDNLIRSTVGYLIIVYPADDFLSSVKALKVFDDRPKKLYSNGYVFPQEISPIKWFSVRDILNGEFYSVVKKDDR